jgi:flagellar biosynthesis chaperone FliJ
MNKSKEELIEEILNMEDILSQVINFQVKLTKEVRKRLYNNTSMSSLSTRYNMLMQTLGSVLTPSSSAM